MPLVKFGIANPVHNSQETGRYKGVLIVIGGVYDSALAGESVYYLLKVAPVLGHRSAGVGYW